MKVVPTELPPGAVLERLHPHEGAPFTHAVVVVQEDGGDTLVLYGLSPGKPPPPSMWRAAKALRYPLAKRVRFERRTNGKDRWVELEFRKHRGN